MSFGHVKLDPADVAFSWWIRYRANWTCERCGTPYEPPTRSLHCSHFQGRGRENTRFDPDNASAHCYGCHQYFTSHPAEHLAWKVQQVGQAKVDEIILKSHMYKKKDRVAEKLYWKQRLLEDFGIVV